MAAKTREAHTCEPELLTAYIEGDRVYLAFSQDVKNLREKGYGDLKRKKVYLSPYETFYLVEKGRVSVRDPRSNNTLTLRNLIKTLGRGEVEIWIKYLVYRDLRERGYIVRGSSMVDFEICGKTVLRRLVSIIHEGTDARLARLKRLLLYAERNRKELILAVIDRRTDIVYYMLDSMEFHEKTAPWISSYKRL